MDAAAYRMCFDEDQLATLCAQYDRRLDSLGAENDKLRELVRDMNECLEHSKPLCKKCKFQERGCQWFEFERRMSELGVDE